MVQAIPLDVLITELISVAKRRREENGAMAFIDMANLAIETRRLIVEAVRDNKLDEKAVARFTQQLDDLIAAPAAVIEPRQPAATVSSMPSVENVASNELRRRLPPTEINAQEVEADMLRIASDMREAAIGVQSRIQRDRKILAMTSDLQDENTRATQGQTQSADAVRRSKRLSFFFTVFMVIASAIIFIVLVPFIIFT